LCAAVPSQSEFAAALEDANIRVHPWSVRNADNSRKSADDISSRLREVIASCSPAILHFNSLSTSRIGGPIARDLGVASLGYIRDIMKLSKKAISDLNQIDRIIAVSGATRQYHINQGINPQKIFSVHNGVDTNLFRPDNEGQAPLPDGEQDIRAELGIPHHAPVLIFVGQLSMRKGIDILLETFFRVAPQTSAHLLIIGQQHSQKEESVLYHRNLAQKADSSQHKNRIHWLGRRKDVANIMRSATILIHPARQEPLGRVLLESAASGLPIVHLNDLLTRLPTQDELNAAQLCKSDFSDSTNDFKDQLNLYLATSLSQTTMELLQNPSKTAEVKKQLRQRALSGFSIEKCASQIDSHYKNLIG